MRLNVGTDHIYCYRAAAIFRAGDRVLLHRAETDSFFALPGGGIEVGEPAQAALVREMREELDAEVEVGALTFVVENFFRHEGRSWHELGLYFECRFTGAARAYYDRATFVGTEDRYVAGRSIPLHFAWVAAADLGAADLRPSFLKDALRAAPGPTRFISHRSESLRE